MTAIHETAYPRLRSNLTDKELRELYTPTPEEMAFVQQVTSSPVTALGVVVLLKTFQRLGYFPAFEGAGKEKRKISDHHLQTIDFL
jgi:Domain of unknown function (DUF4158)